jgi:ribonucleoside-diphosphate reductase subunit M2
MDIINIVNNENILNDSNNQYVIFPISFTNIWDNYKDLISNFWTPAENFENLDKLNLNLYETEYLNNFVCIFSSPSQLKINSYFNECCKQIKITEAKFFYGQELFVLDIHFELFSKLFERIGTEQREYLVYNIENNCSFKNKLNYMYDDLSLKTNLVKAACMHGLWYTSFEITRDWLLSRNQKEKQYEHALIEILNKMMRDHVNFKLLNFARIFLIYLFLIGHYVEFLLSNDKTH